MSVDLPDLLDAFAGLTIGVIGEAMLDSYLIGHAERLCREAPVPVVSGTRRLDVPGGAANTAANVAALGARPIFLSVIGDDAEGWLLRRALEERGIAGDGIIVEAGRATLAKHRVVADSQMLVRYDQGSTGAVGELAEQQLIERLIGVFADCAAVIISDYAYGVLTPRVLEACSRLQQLQADGPPLLVVDARDLSRYRTLGVTVAKPNYTEATKLLGLAEVEATRERTQQIASHARELFERTGARLVAVTLDADGALVLDRDAPPYRTYTRPVAHPHAAGAGDTYTSAFTLALAAGASTPQAAELAALAACTAVAKEETCACSSLELRAALSPHQKVVRDLQQLAAQIAELRRQGRRIVFSNGCFDILHRGHITYLNRAKALGDVLIVGVNADGSVRRLKGAGRPINGIEDRMQVLAALSSVDQIIPFEEDTPEALIRIIRPDIFAKGGDYTRETLPEAALVEQFGGAVQILPFVEDRSTTGIVERIRAAQAPGETSRRRPA